MQKCVWVRLLGSRQDEKNTLDPFKRQRAPSVRRCGMSCESYDAADDDGKDTGARARADKRRMVEESGEEKRDKKVFVCRHRRR